MEINNREDANKYYQMINGLVDDYIDKWKIRPSKLEKYLQPGSERFNNFLERNKLKDIKGTERILKDIIEDRSQMESDGVITFESFKLFESNEFKIHSMKQCLYKGIERANINMEKVLSDYFDTNLGSISVEDTDKHIFKLDDWHGQDKTVVVYSDEEVMVIRDNIFEFLYNEISSKKIEIVDGIDIELGGLIGREEFLNKCATKFNEDAILEVICSVLGSYDLEGSVDGFNIWLRV